MYTHTRDVTRHLTRHLAGNIDAFLLLLARAVLRTVDSLPRKRLAEARCPKRQSTAGPYASPPVPLRFILRRSVQIAEGLEAAAAARAECPACCGPPGDELLLSRASRSRGLTLCGPSRRSRGPGLEKPK